MGFQAQELSIPVTKAYPCISPQIVRQKPANIPLKTVDYSQKRIYFDDYDTFIQ